MGLEERDVGERRHPVEDAREEDEQQRREPEVRDADADEAGEPRRVVDALSRRTAEMTPSGIPIEEREHDREEISSIVIGSAVEMMSLDGCWLRSEWPKSPWKTR